MQSLQKMVFFVLLILTALSSAAQEKQIGSGGHAIIVNKGMAEKRNGQIGLREEFLLNINPELSGRAELLTVDSLGGIYVANHRAGEVLYFSNTGEFIRKVGKRGNRANEYQYIKSMAVTSENRLILLDSYHSKTMIFNDTGALVREYPWRIPRNLYHDNILTADEDTYISIIREARMGATRVMHATVVCSHFDDRKIWELAPVVDGAIVVQKQDGNRSSIIHIENAVKSIVCGDPRKGLIHIIDGDRYQIRTYSSAGKLVRDVTRPYERVRLSKSELDLAEKTTGLEFITGYRNVSEACIADDSGRLWVKTNETRMQDEKLATAWDVFDPAGQYIYRFRLTIDLYAVTKSRIYTIDKNGDVVCYSYQIFQ